MDEIKVKSLTLQSNQITLEQDEIRESILDYLKKLESLESLDLSLNKI